MLITVVLFSLLLVACNLPRAGGGPGGSPGSAGPESTAVLPPSASEPDQTIQPTPTNVLPTPVIPDNWVTYVPESAQDVGFAYPLGWEAVPRDVDTVDVRQDEGQGWLEITQVTSENARRWGLDGYTPGKDARALIDEMLVGLREDGDFKEPVSIRTVEGRDAWLVEGDYYVFNETILVAIIAGTDRVLLITGHGGSGDWSALGSTYRDMVVSVRLGG